MAMMKKVFKLYSSVKFFKFLCAGGTAALVNFLGAVSFRAVAAPYLRDGYTWSIIVGFTLGTILSFYLNKYFTFKIHNEKTHVQLIKFLIASVSTILLASAVAALVLEPLKILWHAHFREASIENLANLVTIGLMTFYNYVVMKYFSFHKIEVRA